MLEPELGPDGVPTGKYRVVGLAEAAAATASMGGQKGSEEEEEGANDHRAKYLGLLRSDKEAEANAAFDALPAGERLLVVLKGLVECNSATEFLAAFQRAPVDTKKMLR
jgi:hypothetical protein